MTAAGQPVSFYSPNRRKRPKLATVRRPLRGTIWSTLALSQRQSRKKKKCEDETPDHASCVLSVGKLLFCLELGLKRPSLRSKETMRETEKKKEKKKLTTTGVGALNFSVFLAPLFPTFRGPRGKSHLCLSPHIHHSKPRTSATTRNKRSFASTERVVMLCPSRSIYTRRESSELDSLELLDPFLNTRRDHLI